MGHSCVYCFDKFEPAETPCSAMQNAFVYTGFQFGTDAEYTIREFCEDVERMRRIIREHRIDVVNCHPLILPGMFAAVLENTPLVMTLHGFGSLSYASFPIDGILMYHGFQFAVSHVFAVSESLQNEFCRLSAAPCTVLRNPIPMHFSFKPTFSKPKEWVLASRFSKEYSAGILSVLEWLPNLDLDKLYIYGTGPCESELKKAASGLRDKVEFCGFSTNWLSEAKDCGGVIGMGRSALEAMAAGFPVLLMSSVSAPLGILDDKLYAERRTENFSGRNFIPIQSPQELNLQLRACCADPEPYCLRDKVVAEYSSKAVTEEFLSKITELRPACGREVHALAEFYSKLCDMEPMCPVYTSQAVFNELKAALVSSMISPHLKSLLISTDYAYRLHSQAAELEEIKRSTTFRVAQKLQHAAEKLRLVRNK